MKQEFVKLPSGEIVVHRTLSGLGLGAAAPDILVDMTPIKNFKQRIVAAQNRDDINKLYKDIDAWYQPARKIAKMVSSSAAKELDKQQASLMLALQAREQELGFVPKLPTEPVKSAIPWGIIALAAGVGLVLVLTMTKRGE